MTSISDLARKAIADLQPHPAVRPEHSGRGIYLDANENPFQYEEACDLNRYPHPQPPLLIAKLAEIYQVSTDQLAVARGSDECIDLLIRVFCEARQDNILICPPTFDIYALSAQIQGAGVIEVALNDENFSLNCDAIRESTTPQTKIIFLCSPNNPTGNCQNRDDMIALCRSFEKSAIVVVDEAYIEFSAEKSMSDLIHELPNLVVLRTLSKAYGLAAARCGVALASAEIIDLLRRVIQTFPVPKPVQDTVLSHLQSDRLLAMQREIHILNEEKEFLAEFLATLPYVKKVWRSDANFLFVDLHEHLISALQLLEHCRTKNLFLRNRSNQSQNRHAVRISIGNPEQNRFLKEVLSDVRS